MRTTLTLDEDVAQQVRRLMHERRRGFKETVNELIRLGLQADRAVEPYRSPVFSSGVRPGVDLDRALALAGQLEDDELMRKIEMRT